MDRDSTILILSTPEAREKMRSSVSMYWWNINTFRVAYDYEDPLPHPFQGIIPEGDGVIPIYLKICDYFKEDIDRVIPEFQFASDEIELITDSQNSSCDS